MRVYTDGACRGNPGPGGWGVFWIDPVDGREREMMGSERHTTNNRMELMAVIMALEETASTNVEICTDSRYVHDGCTVWLDMWVRRGWRTANRQPVLNQDLWMRLAPLLRRGGVSIHWVRAHNGDPGNETADALANQAIDLMGTTSHE